MGEYVGKVKELRGGSFNVAGTASFENGDGLCFVNDRHELEGFRINKAIGNRLYPLKMPADLKPGVALYRNNDVAFSRLLSGVTAERRLPVKMKCRRFRASCCKRRDGGRGSLGNNVCASGGPSAATR